MGRGAEQDVGATASSRAASSGEKLQDRLASGGPIARLLSLQTTNRPVDSFVRWLEKGELDDSPPYQRGDVWGDVRRRNLIRSLAMGLPVGAVFINRRSWSEPYVLVDGKQRLHTIWDFMIGEIPVPGSWFPPEYKANPDEQGDITFPEMSERGQRWFRNGVSIATYETNLEGEDAAEQEKALFDLINFGGLAQGEVDSDLPEPKPSAERSYFIDTPGVPENRKAELDEEESRDPGSAEISDGDTVVLRCSDCKGTGQTIINPDWPAGDEPHQEHCSTCGGSGVDPNSGARWQVSGRREDGKLILTRLHDRTDWRTTHEVREVPVDQQDRYATFDTRRGVAVVFRSQASSS